MKASNTTKPAGIISVGNLDRTRSMQVFLKEAKILTELNKGVMTMKHYLYPSTL